MTRTPKGHRATGASASRNTARTIHTASIAAEDSITGRKPQAHCQIRREACPAMRLQASERVLLCTGTQAGWCNPYARRRRVGNQSAKADAREHFARRLMARVGRHKMGDRTTARRCEGGGPSHAHRRISNTHTHTPSEGASQQHPLAKTRRRAETWTLASNKIARAGLGKCKNAVRLCLIANPNC